MPKIGPNAISLIKDGSSWTDRLLDQFTDGTEPFHAMRAPGQSIDNAREVACGYINPKLQYFKRFGGFTPFTGHSTFLNFYYNPGSDWAADAYFQLGQAMHPIMDSTSPMHEGWQVWHEHAYSYPVTWNSQGHYHGNGGHTEEDLNHLLARPDLINLTLMKMGQALKTYNCSCLH